MLRYLRYAILALIAILLLAVALANRMPVTLNALTPDVAAFAGWSWTITVPLYLVMLGSIVLGLVLGFIWEWLREGKYRSDSRARSREIARLERELGELRAIRPEAGDDVLALLDRPAKAG